jgi:hypothetical protein
MQTLSFDTGYLLKPTNRAVTNFLQEFLGLYGSALTQLDHFLARENWSEWWTRLLLFFAENLVSEYIGGMTQTVYHEFGHFRAFRAFGYKPIFEGGFTHFFPFLLFKLFSGNLNSFTGIPLDKLPSGVNKMQDIPFRTTPYFPTRETCSLVIAAAGVNNAMAFSASLGNQVYERTTHLSSFSAYLMGRLQTVLYPLDKRKMSDMSLIVSNPHYRAWGIDKVDLNISNALALLFSATTYAYISSVGNYVLTGDATVRPFEVAGIRLPDVSAYFGTRGISYEIRTGYRVDSALHIPVHLEFVGRGGAGVELTLGLSKAFPKAQHIRIEAYARLGRGFGGELNLHIPFQKKAFFALGYSLFNAKNFYGERNATSFDPKTPYSHDAWIRFGLVLE